MLPPLHPVTAAFERRMRRLPYGELVERLRSGPPAWSLGGALPGPLEGLTDLHEMYVHHEDLRRPVAPEPRDLPTGLQDALWSRVRALGPGLVARAGLGITAANPDGRSARLRPGADGVVVRGAPGELLLWLFGRRDAARVALVGSAPARDRARTARLGL
jgi:uncharacterized protein (TIGR03085 family)